MDLLPILSTLRRHKTAAGLIVIEIALTSAIVCNALHLISSRLTRLQHDTGLAESELVVLQARASASTEHADEVTLQDLRALRALPGVKSAAISSQVAYGYNSNNSGVKRAPGLQQERVGAAHYNVGEQALATLGLRLLAGRDFLPEEFLSAGSVDAMAQPQVGQVILNQALAERLFPGRSALGQAVYVHGDSPSTVVGVVEKLPPRNPGLGKRARAYAMMFPVRPSFRGGVYLLRSEAGQRERVIQAAGAALAAVDRSRILPPGQTLSEMRSSYYAADRAMAWLMGGVIVLLMLVTALGIVGLASFWVAQRTRMIGTRRALGATRAQIRRYFQLENLLLSALGVTLGMAAALGLNLWLMQRWELPRLPLVFLPVAALALLALGQLAVLAPARRAAALPPVAALRA